MVLIFTTPGFEWQKTVQDFDDCPTWLLYKGGIGVKAVVAGLVLTVAITSLTVTDLFASILVFCKFVPTGWAILCLAITWKPAVKSLGLWKSVSAIAILYDVSMVVGSRSLSFLQGTSRMLSYDNAAPVAFLRLDWTPRHFYGFGTGHWLYCRLVVNHEAAESWYLAILMSRLHVI